MKRIFTFLLLLIIPTIGYSSMLGDVDNRRYVTDEEKTSFPYNTIVRIETSTGSSTGTIVAPNVILTCKHCVQSAGKNGSVNLYLPDGQQKKGVVWHYPDEKTIANDYALVVFDGYDVKSFLNVNDIAVPDDNVSRIGYDFLKILGNDEISIAKKVLSDVIKRNGNVTNENLHKVVFEWEKELQKYRCSSDTDTNCIKCADNESCVFGDGARMKVQKSCSLTKIQKVDSKNTMLISDCAGSPGASGGPLIDSDVKKIIAIFTGAYGFDIGGTTKTYGVRPEFFADKVKTLINMSKNGLLEF